jgi:hypothetical protein
LVPLWFRCDPSQNALNCLGGFADSVTDLAIRGTGAPHGFHTGQSSLLVGVRDELVVKDVKSEWPPASAV